MVCFLYQVLQDFLAQTEARLVRGSSTGHVATSLVCVRTEFSNADLVGVTGDVLCEPERFGGQVFMCGPGRSGECFHVCTCEGTFHRVILGPRLCAFLRQGACCVYCQNIVDFLSDVGAPGKPKGCSIPLMYHWLKV